MFFTRYLILRKQRVIHYSVLHEAIADIKEWFNTFATTENNAFSKGVLTNILTKSEHNQKRPVHNFYKCNLDAAFDHKVGWIIRNNDGIPKFLGISKYWFQ